MATKIIPESTHVKVWQSGTDKANTPFVDLLAEYYEDQRKQRTNGTGNRRRRNRRSRQK